MLLRKYQSLCSAGRAGMSKLQHMLHEQQEDLAGREQGFQQFHGSIAHSRVNVPGYVALPELTKMEDKDMEWLQLVQQVPSVPFCPAGLCLWPSIRLVKA